MKTWQCIVCRFIYEEAKGLPEEGIAAGNRWGDCAEVDGAVLPFVLPIMHAARALASTLAGREQALRYPAMPVVVKTHALPTVICPPPPGASGAWRSDSGTVGVAARFLDANGKLRGFALTGAQSVRKQEILNAIHAS